MVWSDAKLLDSLAMLLRRVALVRPPVVLGVFLGKLIHVVVTVGLGKDRGGSDGEGFGVALDYCGMWKVDGGMWNVECGMRNEKC